MMDKNKRIAHAATKDYVLHLGYADLTSQTSLKRIQKDKKYFDDGEHAPQQISSDQKYPNVTIPAAPSTLFNSNYKEEQLEATLSAEGFSRGRRNINIATFRRDSVSNSIESIDEQTNSTVDKAPSVFHAQKKKCSPTSKITPGLRSTITAAEGGSTTSIMASSEHGRNSAQYHFNNRRNSNFNRFTAFEPQYFGVEAASRRFNLKHNIKPQEQSQMQKPGSKLRRYPQLNQSQQNVSDDKISLQASPIEMPQLDANLAYSVFQFKLQQQPRSLSEMMGQSARDESKFSSNNNDLLPNAVQSPQSGAPDVKGRFNFKEKHWLMKKCLRQQRETGMSWRVDKKNLVKKSQKEMEYEDAEKRVDLQNNCSKIVFGNSKSFFDALEKQRDASTDSITALATKNIDSSHRKMNSTVTGDQTARLLSMQTARLSSVPMSFRSRSISNVSQELTQKPKNSLGQPTYSRGNSDVSTTHAYNSSQTLSLSAVRNTVKGRTSRGQVPIERLTQVNPSIPMLQQKLLTTLQQSQSNFREVAIKKRKQTAATKQHDRDEFERLYQQLRGGDAYGPEKRFEIMKKQPEIPTADGIPKPLPLLKVGKNEFILNPRQITQKRLPMLKKQARKAEKDTWFNKYYNRQERRQVQINEECLKEAMQIFQGQNTAMGSNEIGKSRDSELQDVDIRAFLVTAMRKVRSRQNKERQDEFDRRLEASLKQQKQKLHASFREYEEKKNDQALNSDSDGSVDKLEELAIEIDNTIIQRFREMLGDDKSNQETNLPQGLSKFTKKQYLTKADRHEQIASHIITSKLVKAKSSRWEKPKTNDPIQIEDKPSKFLLKKISQVVRMLEFIEIGRKQESEVFRQVFDKHPMSVYLHQIHNERELELPMINKVIEGKLILTDYTLDSGHFRSLATSIHQTRKPRIDTVYLDNCGVDDEELSLLLAGLGEMQGFHSFVYKNNVFLENSIQAIKPMLLRISPNNLRELRLVNLQTNPLVIQELLEFLIDTQPHLNTLGLVQLHIQARGMDLIAKYVDTSECLEDLDLSWNDVIPQHFTPLLEVLSRKHRLKSLNLSWNTMIDKADHNNKVSFKVKSAMDQMIADRAIAMEKGKVILSKEDEQNDMSHPQYVITCLNRFIRKNVNLQALNLSCTGLNSQVIVGLTQALRHSKGLLCLHLGANPGLTDTVEAFYRERLHIKPPEEKVYLDVKNEDLEAITEVQFEAMSPEDRKILKQKLSKLQEWKLEDVCQYLHNKRLKPLLCRQDVTLKPGGREMSLQRVLGHHEYQPRSGQWRMQTTMEKDGCWHCNNWMFSLVFWNAEIGQHNNINSLGVSAETKQSLLNTINVLNGQQAFSENPNVPVLYSSATNYRPRPFFNLIDYLNTLQKDQPVEPDFEALAIQKAKEVYVFSSFQLLNPSKLTRVNAFIAEQVAEAKASFYYEYRRNRILLTPEILWSHIRFKKPNLINFDLVEKYGNFDQVWVLPIFIQPGKIDLSIRSQAQHDYEVFYSRHVIEVREERVPFYAKTLRTNQQTIKFVKEASVFTGWQEETPAHTALALKHDFSLWKGDRIVTDPEEQNLVKEVIIKHYFKLRCIFIAASIESGDAPDMGKRAFFKFCKQAQMTDGQLNSGIIDTYFKAANYETVEQEGNDDSALIRFEFLEMLLRIAKGKYMEFGNMTSVSKSLEKLIQVHVLPMEEKVVPYEEWRKNQMYTNEVNDLLLSNMNALRKLYEQLVKIKEYPRQKNLIEMYVGRMVTIDQILKELHDRIEFVNDKKIIQAFYAAKEFVQEESVEKGLTQYTTMNWNEFLEFVCRLAQMKYRGRPDDNSVPLATKVKKVLTEILTSVEEPPQVTFVMSDSDDDY